MAAVTLVTVVTLRLGCPRYRHCQRAYVESGGFARRVTLVTVVTLILGYPRRCHPTGEHPANANCRRGLYPPFSARKATPASEKSFRFFRQRMQGVTHYTLQARSVCQTFPLDSLMVAGLTPCVSSAFHFGYKNGGVTVTVLPQGASHKQRHERHKRHTKDYPPKKERRMTEYALCNPAFPETQGRRHCGL